jgi:hypothetical protein
VTRTPPADSPERKPLDEMTPAERREYAAELRRTIRRELAELNRPKRERDLRRGIVKPRNRQEWEIFAADRRRPKPGARAGGPPG